MKILVFPDGHTFSELKGCMIIEVPESLYPDEIQDFIEDEKDTLLYRFSGSDIEMNLLSAMAGA